MVIRCGELFLKGADGVANPERVWDLLDSNIHSVAAFFDHLVVDEKTPIFNYGDTFDMRLDFDKRIFSRINDYEGVLYDVSVEYGPYHEVKNAAITELVKLYDGTHRLSRALADEVLAELSAAEYDWNPSIEGLEHQLESENEKRLAAFLLGGLIFGGYAQELSGKHILQPKRSRLFLAVALGKDTVEHRLEDALFTELKGRSNLRCDELPWTPTFFPYLLSKAKSPVDLVELVVDLRKSAELADYREWLDEVLQDWRRDGRVSTEKRKDVLAITKAIDRVLGGNPSAPRVELKVTVADVVTGKLPGGVDVTPSLEALWGWMLSGIPGNRYRKLLSRAIVADHEYVQLGTRMKTVWTSV